MVAMEEALRGKMHLPTRQMIETLLESTPSFVIVKRK